MQVSHHLRVRLLAHGLVESAMPQIHPRWDDPEDPSSATQDYYLQSQDFPYTPEPLLQHAVSRGAVQKVLSNCEAL